MIRVACAGDSLTASYPKELAPILGPAYVIENDGWGGTTLSTTGKSPYRNRPQFASALAWVKDGGIAIVQLGTNDGSDLAAFATLPADCLDLMRDFKATARVLLVLPPPSPKFLGIDTMVIPALRTCGKEAGVEIVDVHAAFVGHPEWLRDEVHPNAEGDRVMARVIGDAVLHPAAVGKDDASASANDAGGMDAANTSCAETSGCAFVHATGADNVTDAAAWVAVACIVARVARAASIM